MGFRLEGLGHVDMSNESIAPNDCKCAGSGPFGASNHDAAILSRRND